MKTVSMQNINEFLDCDTIVVAGASRKPASFSAEAIKHLNSQGYKTIPLNVNIPDSELPEGWYNSFDKLPVEVSNLLVLTNSKVTDSVIDKAIEIGFKQIWIQQKSDTKYAIEKAESSGANVIHGKCIIMFTNPTGFHKFHFYLTKIFKKLPR